MTFSASGRAPRLRSGIMAPPRDGCEDCSNFFQMKQWRIENDDKKNNKTFTLHFLETRSDLLLNVFTFQWIFWPEVSNLSNNVWSESDSVKTWGYMTLQPNFTTDVHQIHWGNRNTRTIAILPPAALSLIWICLLLLVFHCDFRHILLFHHWIDLLILEWFGSSFIATFLLILPLEGQRQKDFLLLLCLCLWIHHSDWQAAVASYLSSTGPHRVNVSDDLEKTPVTPLFFLLWQSQGVGQTVVHCLETRGSYTN